MGIRLHWRDESREKGGRMRGSVDDSVPYQNGEARKEYIEKVSGKI